MRRDGPIVERDGSGGKGKADGGKEKGRIGNSG